MTLLDEIITYNQQFVANKAYEPYVTDNKFPTKRVMLFTCMDTRLVELSTRALNLTNGDVKVIKNAGAILTHPYGSMMRSIIMAVYLLEVDEIIVMGHYDCGMHKVDTAALVELMKQRGISEQTFDFLKYSGMDVHQWLNGFDDVQDSVLHDIHLIANHPLMPKGIPVHGMVMNPHTGQVDLVKSGY